MARPKLNPVDRVDGSGLLRPERPSITAVARRAAVSIATVSRVVNGGGKVQPELARRVREAIEQIGYLPDGSARALSSGRSRLFGVIISNLRNPFFPELLQHFEEKAVSLGYEVLVASTAYDVQRMGTCINRMLQRKVDGVAVMTFGIEGPLLNRFSEQGVPLVFMDSAPKGPNMFAVQVDYDTGIQQAIQHLAVLGHRRIGLVLGPQHHESVAKRKAALDRAFRRIGMQQSAELVYIGDHSLQSGELALVAFHALDRPPTAILCSNDLSALGVIHAAQEAGISIPTDLSVIGFDGIEIGAYLVPPLTSILMSRQDIAEAAIEALWNHVEGRQHAPEKPIGTQLLIRQTTAIPKGSLDDLTPKADSQQRPSALKRRALQ